MPNDQYQYRTDKYMSVAERREHILINAVTASKTTPYYELRRQDIAAHAGVAPSTINVCFGTMDALRQEILKRAIELELVLVLKYAMGRNEPLLQKMPKALKEKVIAKL